MKSNETLQKNKREPEAPFPPVFYFVGFCWTLVFAWAILTSHDSEILNVAGVAVMVVMVLIIWIARKRKSAHK